MISMANAISSHKRGFQATFSRHNEAIKKVLDECFNAVLEALSMIDNEPYPNSHDSTKATYQLGNSGEPFDLSV